MAHLKIKPLAWAVEAMTEFTPEELEEVGIKASLPTLGLILNDRTVLLPIVRRDGELFAGEFGTMNLEADDTSIAASIGVLCWEPPEQLDWVRGPREDC